MDFLYRKNPIQIIRDVKKHWDHSLDFHLHVSIVFENPHFLSYLTFSTSTFVACAMKPRIEKTTSPQNMEVKQFAKAIRMASK